MKIAAWICRLLARFGIYPRGCPGKPPPPVIIGADKARIKLSQKDNPL